MGYKYFILDPRNLLHMNSSPFVYLKYILNLSEYIPKNLRKFRRRQGENGIRWVSFFIREKVEFKDL